MAIKVQSIKLVNIYLIIFSTELISEVMSFRSHWWHHHEDTNQIGHYQQDEHNNYENGVHPGGGGLDPGPPPPPLLPAGGGHAYLPGIRAPKEIMVDVINNLGLSLLEVHNEHNDNNIALSPYGATSVLIAILEGLLGEAAYEIKTALQLPQELSVVRIGLRDIHRHLKSYFIPKEGFLAGLTLSHDNITLTREYQSILRFYGYDIESFNNPIYPDQTTTTTKSKSSDDTTISSITTSKDDVTTTSSPETTTMESISTILERLTSTTTIGMEGKSETTTESTIPPSTSTTTRREDETTKVPTETTTEMETKATEEENTKLPSPSDETVEGTTTKKLPTRSYTTITPSEDNTATSNVPLGTSTESISVIDGQGTTETFYPMTTTTVDDSQVETSGTTLSTVTNEELKQIRTTNEYLKTTTENLGALPTTLEDFSEFRSTNSLENLDSTSSEELAKTEEDFEDILSPTTLRIPDTSVESITTVSSFKTTEGTFFEATTYIPGKFTTLEGSTPERKQDTTSVTTEGEISTTLNYDFPEGSTLKYGIAESTTENYKTAEFSTTNFEGTTFFSTQIDNTTTSPSLAETTPGISTTTLSEDVVTLTERDNEIFKEQNQKLTNSKETNLSSTTLSYQEVEAITFTTPESIIPYTQTQNTEATSLEDQILGKKALNNSESTNTTFAIDARINTKEKDKSRRISRYTRRINRLAPDNTPMNRRDRKKRSVIDYLIARYYDNYYINANRRHIPNPEPHYTNYQPEEPYTFLVNGKHRETNISFMTYDTILPFYYIRSLDAMALSFPLDSNMYYLLLVLPMDVNGIDKLIYEMKQATTLRNIVERLEYTHVKAVIPSFMLKGYVVLTPSLQKLCIRKIFEPRHANFSPMTPEMNLYVTNIEQAVTVTIRNYMDPASHSARNLNHYRPVEFRADHPFLYFVMDSQIHVNLMAGKIINPLNSRIR